MSYLHCDYDEKYLSLHDCVAERAYFEDGKLGFEFEDGFWISPEHPESHLSNMVRTDASKVEYTLEDGMEYDVDILVYERSVNGAIAGREWSLRELVDAINAGTCKLEFLYQYLGYNCRMVECELRLGDVPDRQTCMMRISAPQVCYYWNKLRADRAW